MNFKNAIVEVTRLCLFVCQGFGIVGIEFIEMDFHEVYRARADCVSALCVTTVHHMIVIVVHLDPD